MRFPNAYLLSGSRERQRPEFVVGTLRVPSAAIGRAMLLPSQLYTLGNSGWFAPLSLAERGRGRGRFAFVAGTFHSAEITGDAVCRCTRVPK
jgi:hypothetical protein